MFRNRVERESKKAKKNYYSNYFQENSRDLKKQWDCIRSIVNLNKNKLSFINELKVENRFIQDQKTIAEELNKFFSNIGPVTENNLPINPVTQPTKYLKDRNHFEFIIAHVSNEEIWRLLKS